MNKFLHKIIGDILKNVQKNMYVYLNEVVWLTFCYNLRNNFTQRSYCMIAATQNRKDFRLFLVQNKKKNKKIEETA